MTAKELGVSPTKRYTRKEAAELLGVSVNTLGRRVRDGLIVPGYYRSNRRPFFPGSEIVRALNDIY